MNNQFDILVQAILDKVKSFQNLTKGLKGIEPKLPKIKVGVELDSQKTQANINTALKKVKAKITVEADTTKAKKQIDDLTKKKTRTVISPTVDNSNLGSGLREAEKQTSSFFGKMTSSLMALNIGRIIFRQIAQAARLAVTNIKELNTSMNNIQMASNASDVEIRNMKQSYNELAKDISSTTKAVATSANEFIRMGESIEDTNTLITNSQMLSNIGMIAGGDAANYLISSMRGYKIAARDSVNIVDKLTSVDMEAAVSAGELAEAMSKTANLANSSGISMDNLIGYLATVQETTQKTASVVGTSFQSMLSRMNNIKINKFIDDETGEDLSDVESVLGKLNIKLRESEFVYRDFDDVLKDISNRWTGFNDVERNAVAVAIAGTRQRENMLALFENFDKALQLSAVSAGSAGTALERYGTYQDSIAAKTNELTAAFEALSTNTISDDLYIGVLQATTGLVEFIDKSQLLKGSLAGIVTFGVANVFTSMANGIMTAARSTSQLTAAMALFNKGKSLDNLTNIGAACIGLSDKQLKLVLSTKGLTNAERMLILQGKGVVEQERQQTLATLGFAQAENTATAATFSFSGALNTLKVAIASNPIGFAIMAITTAVTVGSMAIGKYNQAQEESLRAAQEAAKAYTDSSGSIEDYAEKYEELHDALIKAKGKEEETYAVKKQLLELQTELNEKYGDEYGKINLVTDAYKNQADAIRGLNKELAENYLNTNESQIKEAENQMAEKRHYNLSYTGLSGFNEGNEELFDIARKYSSQGIDLLADTDGNYSIHLNADASNAEETIQAFMSDVRAKAKELGNEHLFDDTLQMSQSSLTSATEILDEYEEIYRNALVAQIAVDPSGNLQKGYSDAVNAVNSYNDAVLRAEDPYNDANVIKAYDNLQLIKSGIQENEAEWGKYSSVMDDVFGSADTKVYDLNNSIKSNQDNIGTFVEKLGKIKTVDLESKINSQDASIYNDLSKYADKYNMSVDDLVDGLKKLGYIQEEVFSQDQDINTSPVTKAEMITKVNELSEGFEALDKIMASVKDKNPFNYALLDDKNFKEIFSPLGEEYTNFVETISKSPKDISACQSAFDSLLTSLISQSGTMDGLTDEYVDLTTAMLKNMGVANAEEFVTSALAQNHDKLAAQKYYSAKASAALESATAQEIPGILYEAEAAGIAAGEIAKLELAKYDANSIVLATDGDIASIKALMEACGHGVTAIIAFQEAKKGLFGAIEGTISVDGWMDLTEIGIKKKDNNYRAAVEEYVTSAKALEADINSAINSVNTSAQYNGGTKTNKPSGSGGSKKEKEEKEKEKEFDWMQRALDAMNKQREEYQSIVDDETESYADQISALKELIALDQQYIDLNAKAVETYTDRWEKAKQKIIETFGEIKGDENITKIELGDNSIEGSLSNIKGEDNIKAIEDAITAYDDLSDAKDKQVEEEKKRAQRIRDMYQARIDEIKSFISEAESALSMAQSEMDIKEITGKEITERDYKDLIALSEDQIDLYYDQISALQDLQGEVEEQGPEYYNIQSQIASCEAAIASAEKQQAEWNEEIKRLPIKRIERYLELLGHIKQDLQNFMDEQSTLGVTDNKDQHQQLIDISQEEIDKLLEQQQMLRDVLGNYEYNSDKFNSTKSEISDIKNEISDLIQAQYEWNKAILQIPINQLTKANEALQSVSNTMGEVISDYDTVIDTIVSTVDKEIESINDLKDAASKEYEERINVYQEQLDLLQKQNKERQIQLALEQAQYDLERAMGQKNVSVIRDGEMVWENDLDAVRNAQESLQDAEYNKTIHELEKQIETLEDARDTLLESYDAQLEKLEEIKSKWSELVDEIKLAADTLKVTDMFGEGWQEKVLSGNDSAMYESMKDMYSTIYNQQQAYQDQIASNERIADMMNQFMDKFYDGSLTYEQAMAGIDNLMNSMADGFSSLEHLDSLLNINGASDLNNLLSNMKDSAAESVNQFQEYMSIVKANADSLDKYSSTWEEMQKSIQEQITELKRLYEENLKRRQESASRKRSSSSGSERDETKTSSKTGPGGSTYSYDSGKTYDSYSDYWDSERDPDRHHSGVDAGYVGATAGTQDEKLKAMKALTTKDLAKNEVPILAQMGELVMTPSQISNLLDNIDVDYMGNMNRMHQQMFSKSPFESDSSRIGNLQVVDRTPNIEFDCSNMNVSLTDVRDVDGFAKAMSKDYARIMRQELSKYNHHRT